jgi:transposase
MAAVRVFKAEFRISIAQRILDGESVSSLRSKHKIKRSILYRWRDLLRDQGAAGFSRPRGRPPGTSSKAVAGASTGAEQKIAELERRLGRLAMENGVDPTVVSPRAIWPKPNPLERVVRPQFAAVSKEHAHWPSGGCHSSTLFPSGSITQANLPYSDSSICSSTLQPSSFKALTKA